MLIYSAITSASDSASTSDFNDVLRENGGAYVDEWNHLDGSEVTKTTTESYLTCIGCHRGTDLAQSFVLYFAPTVIVLALIMCITRLLFTFCAFRRQQVTSTPPPSSSSRHHSNRSHTRTNDDLRSMTYHSRGSFAHIFMQTPPPTYEQAQKHSVPFESPNDPPPPAYTYENPTCIRDEQPPTGSTTSTINATDAHVIDIQPSTDACVACVKHNV